MFEKISGTDYTGEFDNITIVLLNFSHERLFAFFLRYIDVDKGNVIPAYTLIWCMIQKREVVYYHYLASIIAQCFMSHYTRKWLLFRVYNKSGLYTSLFHASQAGLDDLELYLKAFSQDMPLVNSEAISPYSVWALEVIQSGTFDIIADEHANAQQPFFKDFIFDIVQALPVEAYALTWLMICKKESAKYHILAHEIMLSFGNQGDFCCGYIEQCEEVALFHIRRAMKLDSKKVKWQEFFLLFSSRPHVKISDAEVESVAQEILKKDFGNKVASDVLTTRELWRNKR